MSKTFSNAQREQLAKRRKLEKPSVVLDFYAARAILEEGLEEFWPVYRFATQGADTSLILEKLVDLSARCQQVAEDLNLIDHDTDNETFIAKHNRLVNLVQNILKHIHTNHVKVPSAQLGKTQFAFHFDKAWIDDILEQLDNVNLLVPAHS